MKLFFKYYQSPIGKLKLIASTKGLFAILWPNDNDARIKLSVAIEDNSHHVLKVTEKQLTQYFNGKRKAFDLPLDLQGTGFQKSAWRALLKIPYGKTWSYKKQAELIGDFKKARAVGAANGRNPISIVIPCHRVIGSNGELTGFAAGLKTKKFLLELEEKINQE
ncbi:MAG: methylated-DNA--[protein]-cysteine S-methyltransferase [Oligoflexia bacterium]|nr:methylated-DNA--[protein]-cysteine S-methyltransferase [Oligoflexia bacterium]